MKAYGTGLRIHEAGSRRTDDIDGKPKLIHLRNGKPALDRCLMLPDHLRQFLSPGTLLTPTDLPCAAASSPFADSRDTADDLDLLLRLSDVRADLLRYRQEASTASDQLRLRHTRIAQVDAGLREDTRRLTALDHDGQSDRVTIDLLEDAVAGGQRSQVVPALSVCARLLIRHTTLMPKSRPPGYSRPCLVVGSRGDAAVSRILGDAGFEVESVGSEQEAWEALDRKPWTVLFVAQSVGKGALQSLIVHAGQKRAELPVVVLGVGAKLQDAVDAMQLGAADFLAPPFSSDAILSRLERLVVEAPAASPETTGVPSLEHLGLTGKSTAMAKVYAGLARISRYKTNVLVLGESGSGKELVARALHAMGPRRNHLFVPLNCATLGRDILENELFGHERGAFTGANDRKKGLFELADGGTLFLDEIGELDPSTQAKLLRVIERNEFRRVGGTGKIKVDLSLIAATNRNLDEAIATKRFREDLYYRLKVVTINVPPLRERREDIPALIDFFIADFNRRNDGKIKGLSPEALRSLTENPWRGNVRELKNAVESAAIMAAGDTIGLGDLESVQLGGFPWRESSGSGPRTTSLSAALSGEMIPIPAKATLADAERILISAHLDRVQTKTEAARNLGIGLRTLYTKIQQLRLRGPTRSTALTGAPAART